ncbi:MAG TPA: FG-GAP-like repeat-containing protein, partial [Gammaproteobacteria bacterium]|nr:FG-GAP-like repeat-containing protein [Gammaproteobacteria bacterium]
MTSNLLDLLKKDHGNVRRIICACLLLISAPALATVNFGRTDFPVDNYPRSVALGDMDGNGTLDVVTAGGNGDWPGHSVSVLLGDGAGNFAKEPRFFMGYGSPYSVALGDVNADGDLDAITANLGPDSISVLLGDGAGGFGTKTDFTVGDSPRSVALGDLNADGDLDVVTANDDSISVLLGDGAGGFGSKTDFPVGNFPHSVALGDVDGDGKLDVVTANYGSSISVLLGDGAGGFASKTDFTVGDFPRAVALGDLNADGDLDVVTANAQFDSPGDRNNDTVSVLLQTNTAPVADDGALTLDQNTVGHGTLVATDANGDALTYSLVDDVQHGTVTLVDDATGDYTYAPTTGYSGADSFTFQASDGIADSNTATISITVNAVNSAPVASNGTLTLNQDTTASGTLAATDADGDSLTYNIVSGTQHGTATLTNAATGAYDYAPDTGYSGPDSFTFNVSDGSADSNTATVFITVNAVTAGNDAPVASNGALTLNQNTVGHGTLVATDSDSDTLTYNIVTGAQHGTVTLT